MAKAKRIVKYVGVKVGRRARRSGLDLAKDLWLAVSVFFGNVGALVGLCVTIALAVTHTADKAEGVVFNWARNYPNNAVFAFASHHIVQVIGLLAFVPTFMLVPKRSFPVLVMASTILMLCILPEANFYQYLTLSALLHLFLHARLPSTRIIVVAGVVLYVVFLHHFLSSVQHPSEHFKTIVQASRSLENSPSLERQNAKKGHQAPGL